MSRRKAEEPVKFRRAPAEHVPFQARGSRVETTPILAGAPRFRDRSRRLRWWWSGPYRRLSAAVAAVAVGALLLWVGVTGLRAG